MDCARETRPASAAARAGSGVACSAAIPCHGETSPSSAGNGLPRSTRRHSSLDANSAISLVSTTGPSISCSCETMAADWQALNWNSMWRCRQVRLLERISFNFHAKLSSSLLRYVQTKSLYNYLLVYFVMSKQNPCTKSLYFRCVNYCNISYIVVFLTCTNNQITKSIACMSDSSSMIASNHFHRLCYGIFSRRVFSTELADLRNGGEEF